MVQQWSRGIEHPVMLAILIGGVLVPTLPTTAQLLPDSSLGAESSAVTSGVNGIGQPADLIEGGARRGSNVFHSFQDFNVDNFQQVYFVNPDGVETIVSRVTGINPSNILGTIGVLGSADLFLLNPNGIFFGPNATLDVRGSFVASTASSLLFSDGMEFSAVKPSAPPLLTVSVPIGLQFNGGEGDIIVQAGQVPPPNNLFAEMGDAGQSLETAQIVNSPTSAVIFDAISGSLNPETDVDLYQIFLLEGQPFTASTVRGTSINTQLFLFDGDGLGLFANNDSVGFQSTVPLYQPFIPNRSGTYYLAISSYDNDPRSSRGEIFNAVETPNPPGAGFPLIGWSEMPRIPTVRPSNGPYTITLSTRGEGLQVQSGRTLALVGNQVRLEGGRLEALGGQVELAGVEGAGIVGLAQQDQEWRLNFPRELASADVLLDNNALINVRAGGGGNITIHSRNMNMTSSSLLAGIAPGLGAVGSRASNIEINAARAINLDASSIANDVAIGARGNGGDIILTTGAFSAVNGAGLYSRVYGSGNAGSIRIEARNAASFDYSLAFSVVTPVGQGRGGDIRISADSVSVTNIAQLATLTQGNGDAGNIVINARDTVRFDGSDRRLRIASSAFSSVGDNSLSGSMAVGNGGDIHITANSVFFTNRAQLITATNGQGDAGNVRIRAHDAVSFDGGSGAISGVAQAGIGFGGNIHITSKVFWLSNSAELFVGSVGSGAAGSLTIEADAIRLDNQGRMNGDTVNEGGNISLRSPLILFRRNSSITTNARGTATGGSININAGSGFIISAPNENNDIIANAEQGSGGQITLTAQDVLGFNARTRRELQQLLNPPSPLNPQRLTTNDISAFSETNPIIDIGTVTLQTPVIDLTQGLTALPTDILDPIPMIAATCPADEGSSFAITGRGGLPEDPRQPLMGQAIWQDERSVMEDREQVVESIMELEIEQDNVVQGAIAEAQGWIIDRAGNIVLLARDPSRNRPGGLRHPFCASSNNLP